jgi:hypothetical protein
MKKLIFLAILLNKLAVGADINNDLYKELTIIGEFFLLGGKNYEVSIYAIQSSDGRTFYPSNSQSFKELKTGLKAKFKFKMLDSAKNENDVEIISFELIKDQCIIL